MSDRVFTADEVNAALKLAGVSWSCNFDPPVGVIRQLWQSWRSADSLRQWVAALALGVLPKGWELTYDSRGALYVYNSAAWYISAQEGTYGADDTIASDNWPEAVRSCQAEIACRLLAAHVELERLRAGGAA